MHFFGGGEELLQRSDVPQWNLLNGSSNWSGVWHQATSGDGSVTNLKDQYGNLFVRHSTSAWQGTNQSCYLTESRFYTFSLIFKNETKTIIHCQFFANQVAGATVEIQPVVTYIDGSKVVADDKGNIALPKDDLEHIISFTFAVTKSGISNLRMEVPEGGSYLISSFKLEYGTKATRWMPAITDLMLKNENGGN